MENLIFYPQRLTQWCVYHCQAMFCTIKVDYDGTATKAEFYAAPTGTETDDEKTLIGTVDVDRTANSVSLEWEPDGFMGYISVILYNDSATVSSEDNWLIKVISDE